MAESKQETREQNSRKGKASLFDSLFPLCSLLLVFGLAFSLRLINLGSLGLWGDEAWGLYLTHRGLVNLTLETGRDIHPPLYYYIAYFWFQFAGSGEFSFRYLSVFAGTLVVAITFVLGRRLAGARVGTVGALLVACAPFAVHYGQEARPFMWATLWCVLAFHVLLRALDSSSRLAWGGYVVLSLLSVFTLYSAVFWFAAHGALLLIRRDWRQHFFEWLGAGALAGALALPWLLIFGRATGAHLTGQGAFTAREVLPVYVLVVRLVTGLVAGVTLPPAVIWGLSGLILAVAVAGVFVARQRTWRTAGVLAMLALLPVLALYPIHVRFPWFEPRVLAFCVVPLCLFLAVGLDGWLTRGRWTFIAAGAILGAAYGAGLYDYYYFSRYSPELEDYRPLVAHVQERAAPGDIVLYNAPWHVGYFEAYYRGPPLDFRPLAMDSVARIADGPGQVWVILRDIVRQPGGTRPEDRAEDLLSANAFKVGEAWFGHIRLAHYVVPPPGQPTSHPLDAALGRNPSSAPELKLSGFTIQPELGEGVLTVEPEQAVYLTLIWQAERSLDGAYNVFSHIVGPFNPATGNPIWAQHDGLPGNQERPTTSWQAGERILDRHVMWIDAAAPPGDYLLEVGMYDPETGVRLSVMQSDGTPFDHVILARVRVVAP